MQVKCKNIILLPQTTTRGRTLYENIPATKSDFNLYTTTRSTGVPGLSPGIPPGSCERSVKGP